MEFQQEHLCAVYAVVIQGTRYCPKPETSAPIEPTLHYDTLPT